MSRPPGYRFPPATVVPSPVPPSLPSGTTPAVPSTAPAGARLPLAWAAVLWVACVTVLAGGVAYALVALLGWGVGWAAAAGASLAVGLGAVPVAALLMRVAGQGATVEAALRLLPGGGLPRALFMDLAEREWARARRYGSGAALLLVDVDHGARLREIRGVEAGELVLAELLRQTAPTLRVADVLTRFGEHQMAVFLAQADAMGALDVAERIRERAELLELPWQAQRLRFTVSIGVAALRPAHLSLQAVVDDAVDAMHAARQAGGNCVRAAPVDVARQPQPDRGEPRDERRAPRP